jgi:hypothetical protein
MNEREIAKFSRRDASRFADYEALLERVAHHVEPLLDWTPPSRSGRPPPPHAPRGPVGGGGGRPGGGRPARTCRTWSSS